MPGDYLVGNREGSTAICTLANADLPGRFMSLDEPALGSGASDRQEAALGEPDRRQAGVPADPETF